MAEINKEQTSVPSPEVAQDISRRDRFRENIRSRNGDLNLDDDDAYYDYLDSQMNERDSYENALTNLRESIGDNPELAEMLVEASSQKNYAPITYLLRKVSKGEIDLDALREDPEYVDKFTEAQAESLKKRETQRKIEEEGQKNFESSIAMMKSIQKERGLTDEQVNEAMSKVYQIFDDLLVNKISSETFNAILDAMNYSDAVAEAHDAGKAEGLNTKVREQLRKPSAENRVGGSQPPVKDAPLPEKESSMFGL